MITTPSVVAGGCCASAPSKTGVPASCDTHHGCDVGPRVPTTGPGWTDYSSVVRGTPARSSAHRIVQADARVGIDDEPGSTGIGLGRQPDRERPEAGRRQHERVDSGVVINAASRHAPRRARAERARGEPGADRRPITAAGVALLVSALIGGVVHLTAEDPRRDLDLVELIASSAGAGPVLPGGHEATSALCGSSDPCIQAVQSDSTTLRRYEHRDEAQVAAARLGRFGHLSGWLVAEYAPGDLSEHAREVLQVALSGRSADGPD